MHQIKYKNQNYFNTNVFKFSGKFKKFRTKSVVFPRKLKNTIIIKWLMWSVNIKYYLKFRLNVHGHNYTLLKRNINHINSGRNQPMNVENDMTHHAPHLVKI